MPSAHWQQKMKTVFRRLDLDKDGALSRNDAKLMAEQFVQYGSLERYEAEPFIEQVVGLFDLLIANVNNDNRHKVKEDDFIKIAEQRVSDSKKKQSFLQASEPVLQILFKCIDIDGNKQVTRSDFNTFMRLQFGRAQPGEDDMFGAMDANQDGFVDWDEYKQSYAGFWTEEKESGASLHYGPLVK